MKVSSFVIACLFIVLTVSVSAQSFNGKNVTELEAMQKEAVAKEDYDLAEKIKQQLLLLEKKSKEANSPPKAIEKKYDNDKLMAKGFIQNGKGSGFWELYTKSGYKNMEGDVVNGKPVGNWKTMNRSGKVTHISDFSKPLMEMKPLDRSTYNLIYKKVNN